MTRTALPLLVLLLAAAAARADVVILKGNDVPLTGRIVKEDAHSVRFQIKGLGDASFVDIEKSRIIRMWREENTYWDYLEGERARKEVLERLRGDDDVGGPGADGAEKGAAESGPDEAPGGEAAGPPVPEKSRARTDHEIRRDLVEITVERFSSVVPEHPALRIVLFLVLYGALTLLVFAGSRVADLPKLRLGRSAILALVATLFVGSTAWGAWSGRLEQSVPVLAAGETALWVLVSRLLAGGPLSKSVLLLSFVLASIVLLAATMFSILSAF